MNKHRRRRLHHVPGSPAIEIANLSVIYARGTALEQVNLSLAPGEHLAVLGPNGAGKSTLLKTMAGVISPSAGEVRVYGHGPRGHVCIAYLPQRSEVDWSFPVTVRDVVCMGRIGKLSPWRRYGPKDASAVRESLARVRLDRLADRHISELSGGQKQRMFIARALAQEAELILMDEPLAGLDATTQEALLRLIGELTGPTLVVAMHELRVARERFPRLLLLNRKVIALGPPSEVVNAQALERAYGRALQIVDTEEGAYAVGDSCCPPEEAAGD